MAIHQGPRRLSTPLGWPAAWGYRRHAGAPGAACEFRIVSRVSGRATSSQKPCPAGTALRPTTEEEMASAPRISQAVTGRFHLDAGQRRAKCSGGKRSGGLRRGIKTQTIRAHGGLARGTPVAPPAPRTWPRVAFRGWLIARLPLAISARSRCWHWSIGIDPATQRVCETSQHARRQPYRRCSESAGVRQDDLKSLAAGSSSG